MTNTKPKDWNKEARSIVGTKRAIFLYTELRDGFNNKIDGIKDYEELIELVANRLKSQEQEIRESIVKEIDGMKKKRPKDKYDYPSDTFRRAGYNQSLQDIIKKLS